MAQRMTKHAAETLKQATALVEQFVTDGLPPTDAVVKAARELQLPSEMVRLTAQAFNIGEQIASHKSAASLLDRLEEHPLADARAAIAEVFGTAPETPAQQHHKTAVSADYSRPPRIAAPEQEKRAFAGIPPLKPRTAAPSMTASKPPVQKALGQCKAAMRRVDQLQAEVYATRDAAFTAFGKLASWVRRQPNFVEAFLELDTYGGDVCGSMAAPVLDYVATQVDGAAQQRLKRASAYAPAHLVTAHAELPQYQLLSGAISALSRWYDKQAEYTQAQQQLPDTVATLLAPYDDALHAEPNILVDHDSLRTKSASLLPGMLGGAAATQALEGLGIGKSPDSLANSARSEFESGEHMADMRKIDAETLLHDMLYNDDAFQTYQPSQVIDSYNQLSTLGPRLSGQPAIMRPLVRKMLAQQGQLDPHDIEQIIGLDNSLGRRELPPGRQVPPSPGKAALWHAPDSVLA